MSAVRCHYPVPRLEGRGRANRHSLLTDGAVHRTVHQPSTLENKQALLETTYHVELEKLERKCLRDTPPVILGNGDLAPIEVQ